MLLYMNNATIMNVLKRLAESIEPVFQVRFSSAVVFKNEIISFGVNKNKSHPFQKRYSSHSDAIYLHAETDAIYNALRKYNTEVLAKSKLFVYRAKWIDGYKETFMQGLAKPCIGCRKAIATFGIKEVYYSLEQKDYEIL